MSSSQRLLPGSSAKRLLAALAVPAVLQAFFAPAAAAQGAVLVVDDDGGPGVDFTSLAEAVVAAQDGDTVLVREGVYETGSGEACSVVGKSLVVTAEAGAEVLVKPGTLGSPLHVSGLAAHQETLLRGLIFELGDGVFNASIFSNAGSVRLEQCVLRGSDVLAGTWRSMPPATRDSRASRSCYRAARSQAWGPRRPISTRARSCARATSCA
jgi:hypothetical protein